MKILDQLSTSWGQGRRDAEAYGHLGLFLTSARVFGPAGGRGIAWPEPSPSSPAGLNLAGFFRLFGLIEWERVHPDKYITGS